MLRRGRRRGRSRQDLRWNRKFWSTGSAREEGIAKGRLVRGLAFGLVGEWDDYGFELSEMENGMIMDLS